MEDPFDYLDEIFVEEPEPVDVIFRGLPKEILYLILYDAGKNGMSVCRETRRIFLKLGVSIRSISEIEYPVHEGLYLLLRYAKSIHYDCFQILEKSHQTDLPKLEVLKIIGKDKRSLTVFDISSFKMPKLERIIFRTKGLLYYQKIFSMDRFTYFEKMTRVINNPGTLYFIDAELEYVGLSFVKPFRYRKIIVKQRLLKSLILGLKLSEESQFLKNIKKIKTLKVLIKNLEVFDHLDTDEINTLRNNVENISVFSITTIDHPERLPEFCDRYGKIFGDFKIQISEIYESPEISEISEISEILENEEITENYSPSDFAFLDEPSDN